jgi:hypothetical protein
LSHRSIHHEKPSHLLGSLGSIFGKVRLRERIQIETRQKENENKAIRIVILDVSPSSKDQNAVHSAIRIVILDVSPSSKDQNAVHSKAVHSNKAVHFKDVHIQVHIKDVHIQAIQFEKEEGEVRPTSSFIR